TWVGDNISNQTAPNRYTITRTYQATDVCGNSSTCAQTITVLPPGAALDFDGANDYVSVPYDPTLHPTAAITMEAWVRPQTGSGPFARVADNESCQLLLGANLYPRWQISTYGALVAPTPVTAGDWHHIAGAYDGSSTRLYVDGVMVASAPASGNLSAST